MKFLKTLLDNINKNFSKDKKLTVIKILKNSVQLNKKFIYEKKLKEIESEKIKY